MFRCLLAVAACAGAAVPATAQTIIGAKSAVINIGGPGSGSIADTYNQNGLATKYISGVTNFDTYIAGDPRHSAIFLNFEWFSYNGANSAQVTYDLGSIFSIDQLALWNEEGSGIGLLTLLSSTDGLSFSSIGAFTPTDNPVSLTPATDTYGADVFSFAMRSTRYVRFDMSGCPQPKNNYAGCAIGEVAFRTASVGGAVPEPATWMMMMIGFGAVGFITRRRRTGFAPRQIA